LLNQKELEFQDTTLELGDELILMKTPEKIGDVYGKNDDDEEEKTVFTTNLLLSDDELNAENQWLLHQEIKDFDPMDFPEVTVKISASPLPVTIDQPPKVKSSAIYSYHNQEVLKIIKHKINGKTEYSFDFPTLSLSTRMADSYKPKLLNPLYSPEFCQYLQKCWWKTVVLWGNLTTKIRERHRRTSATVEVAHNILKTFDIKSRNLDLPQYLEKRVEAIYGNQLLAGEKMAQTMITTQKTLKRKHDNPKEGWNRDLQVPLSVEDVTFMKDFKEAYNYARQHVKKTQAEIGKDIGHFAVDGKPVSQSALSKVLTRNAIPGSHRTAIAAWVTDQLEKKKAYEQLMARMQNK
jgi:hypothetical protein